MALDNITIESEKIIKFRSTHECIYGIVEDKHVEKGRIDSFRASYESDDETKQHLIKIPDCFIIPPAGLALGDEVLYQAVNNEVDFENGYNGSLRGLANITTNRVYEVSDEDVGDHLRAIIDTSEIDRGS